MIPAGGMPISASGGASSAKSDSSGVSASPWNQGDFVIGWGDGDPRTGDRTAPGGSLTGAVGGLGMPLIVAGTIIVGALLWKRFR